MTTSYYPHRRRRGRIGETQQHAPRASKPKEGSRARPVRVHEVATEKRSDARRAPYAPKKSQPRTKAIDELPFWPKFRMTYKELLGMPGMTNKLRFPPKLDRNLGSRKEI